MSQHLGPPSTFERNLLPRLRAQNQSIPAVIARAATFNLEHAAVQRQPTDPLPTLLANFRVNHSRYGHYKPDTMGYRPGTQFVLNFEAYLRPPPAANQGLINSECPVFRYSHEDMPPVLFGLSPPADRFKYITGHDIPVPMLRDLDTGAQVRNSRGAPLRYFSFLPRFISTDVSGEQLEAWFRTDTRLENNDILARMETVPGMLDPTAKKAGNTLNMRRNRAREKLGVFAWHDNAVWPGHNELLLLDTLTSEQVLFNTAMKVDIANRRLLKPVYSDDNAHHLLGYVDSGLPMDYFLHDPLNTIPSCRMVATITLRQRMQHLACILGIRSHPDCWKRVPRDFDPDWWKNPGIDEPIEELDGKSHRQYMLEMFGSNLGGLEGRARTRGWLV